jgi:hypothetical protein
VTEYDAARTVARSLRHYIDDHAHQLTQAERHDLEHARRILQRKQRPTPPL